MNEAYNFEGPVDVMAVCKYVCKYGFLVKAGIAP